MTNRCQVLCFSLLELSGPSPFLRTYIWPRNALYRLDPPGASARRRWQRRYPRYELHSLQHIANDYTHTHTFLHREATLVRLGRFSFTYHHIP